MPLFHYCGAKSSRISRQNNPRAPPVGTFPRSLTSIFRSPSPFEGKRVRNSTKSSVADRTGAFTRGDAFTINRDFTVEFNGIFSTEIPVRSSVENP